MSPVEGLRFRERQLALHRGTTTGHPHPTLLLLHGYGADEFDLISLHTYFPEDMDVICVRGEARTPYGGAAWFDIGVENDGRLIFREDQALEAGRRMGMLIEAMTREGIIEPGPLILGGFSQGGSVAMLLFALQPKTFAGLMILSSRMTDNLQDLLAAAEIPASLPVFAAHGLQDPVLPLQYGREINEFWKGLNVDFEYHEYNMGHQVNPQELRDIRHWLNGFQMGE